MIYVASSWRNADQPFIVKVLRGAGHEVYDFRNPKPGDHGFSWSEIDQGWMSWRWEKFKAVINHPLAVKGFNSDMDALQLCTACVLVLPCGRSAHLEAGYMIGVGKPVAIYSHYPTEFHEPELMYRMADRLVCGPDELEAWAKEVCAS